MCAVGDNWAGAPVNCKSTGEFILNFILVMQHGGKSPDVGILYWNYIIFTRTLELFCGA